MIGIKKSPWILHYDASSCNGCDIEVLACLTPVYDLERFGVINTGNPKHADIFLITGAVNEQNRSVVETLYHQLPEPKVVVAIGICATSGGIFRECYNIAGGVDTIIPVDVYVPGCAARPEVIIDGVVEALGVLEEKRRMMQKMAGSIDQAILQVARPEHLPEILALQKIAYRSEAEIYNDYSLPALNQTLAELQDAITKQTFLSLLVNGKIIGSIRGYVDNDTGKICRVIVHPYFQNRGLGSRLIAEMEANLSTATRFEVFTGTKSKRNIYLYEKRGYKPFKTEKFSATVDWIYLEKTRS